MTAALLLAALVAAGNAGISRAARAWADKARGADGWDARWSKSQAWAAGLRLAVFLGGMVAAWSLTRRAGPLVTYIFAAAVGQMVLQIYLLNKGKV